MASKDGEIESGSKTYENVKIAIIGAGVAGLAAAQKLHEYKFSNTVVLEALDRVGGRIHTIHTDGGFVEIGASWLHGEEGNILFDIAKERHLVDISEDQSAEGDGKFCTSDGDQLDHDMVKSVLGVLEDIKDKFRCYKTPEDESCIRSAGEVFREDFEKYVSEENPSFDKRILWGLFDWFVKFEDIDNACRNLNDCSIKAYSEWYECEGLQLIDLKSGFQSVVNLILKYLPPDVVKLNSPVKQINYQTPNPELILENGERIVVDHVIITSSVGFLQENLTTFFNPRLDQVKEETIKSIGFDTINKIYLEFQNPFWTSEELGFQLIWTSKDESFPSWVKDISGFDCVKNHPRMLLCWIGSDGAEEVELVSDEEVKRVCASLLRKFLKNAQLPDPVRIIRSKWKSNKYIRGAYSYRSLQYERNRNSIHDLITPVVKETKIDGVKSLKPILCFAGEATDPNYYSTTHGALQSGLREAQRILDYYCAENDLEVSL